MKTPACFLLSLALATAAAGAQVYTIDQPLGPDTFGGRSGGQIFTPSVGIMPNPGAPGVLPLTKFTMHYGNLGAVTPSATTFLNIYDGDPNNGGNFWGSSTNSLDTTAAAGLTYGTALVWDFDALPMLYNTQYWAIMSSTNVAGNVPLEVSLQTSDRFGPNVYTGGAGIIANLVPHPNSVDATFTAEFTVNGATFTTTGNGCPSSAGPSNLSASALPVLGQNLLVDMDNVAPAALQMMVIGTSDASWNGAPLPIPISIALPSAPSCFLLVSADVLVGPLPVSSGVATMTFAIPTTTTLVGFTMFFQGMQFEAAGVSATAKGTAVVGY